MKQILVSLFVLCSVFCKAQVVDSLFQDSAAVEVHSPRKATIYSAIAPGLGQIYNKQWYKAPFIYAGMGAGIYFAIFSRSVYSEYKDAYIAVGNGETNPFPNLTEANIASEMDRYLSYFEWSIIGTVVVYTLNVVDANVYGHLFTFDVGDELSLRVAPDLFPSSLSNTTFAGFRMTLKF